MRCIIFFFNVHLHAFCIVSSFTLIQGFSINSSSSVQVLYFGWDHYINVFSVLFVTPKNLHNTMWKDWGKSENSTEQQCGRLNHMGDYLRLSKCGMRKGTGCNARGLFYLSKQFMDFVIY